MHTQRKSLAHVFAGIGLLLIAANARGSSKPSDAELAAITKHGIVLAEYDKAAWQATDAVQAVHPAEGRVGRYIGRKTEAGWVVDFGRLNDAGDKFLVAYEAVQTGNATRFAVKGFDPVREDAGWNLAAAKGIETALGDFGGSSRPYNIAVLPAESEGMYVYLYPAQVKAGVYPLGADVRYHLSRNGIKIGEKRRMHNSIIESVPARADTKLVSGYHTHVLSDVPEDTDVLLVLTRQPRVSEIVVARTYVYTIGVDGKIAVANRPR